MQAKERFDQGDFAGVISEFGNTNDADDLELLGLSYQRTGQFDQAMDVWNRLIRRLPEAAPFYLERGVCKFNLKFPHALDDFDRAIKLDPGNAYYFACRAFVKDKLGDTEGAVEDYRNAHHLDPEDALTLNNLGLAEQKLGHTANARRFFRQSNDLLGINTADAEPTATKRTSPSRAQKWTEVGKMLGSWKEFKAFLRDLFKK